MLRYCLVAFALLTAYGQARAQSITINTPVPTKDVVDTTGSFNLAGKIYLSGLIQLKQGMNPYKTYGVITKYSAP